MALERECLHLHQISELKASLTIHPTFFLTVTHHHILIPFLPILILNGPSLQLSLVLLFLSQLPDEAYSRRKHTHADLA